MRTLLILASAALMLTAGANAQKQPAPKTQDEAKVLQAMFGATDVDSQIKAANDLLEKFADTDFKGLALQVLAADYERKNDFAKAIVFGERTLETDPKNFDAMLVLARQYAKTTKDTDFDKEDKLKKAEKYANDAINAAQSASKPFEKMPDEQWAGQKKDAVSQAHEVLGLVALVRKKPDVAATEFKTSVDGAATPDPATYVRLASAYNQTGKYDDAIAACEKAMASPNAVPAVKQYAQAEKVRATQNKAKGAAPAPTPAQPPAQPPAQSPAQPPAPKQ